MVVGQLVCTCHATTRARITHHNKTHTEPVPPPKQFTLYSQPTIRKQTQRNGLESVPVNDSAILGSPSRCLHLQACKQDRGCGCQLPLNLRASSHSSSVMCLGGECATVHRWSTSAHVATETACAWLALRIQCALRLHTNFSTFD